MNYAAKVCIPSSKIRYPGESKYRSYFNANVNLQHNITPLHVAAKWGRNNMVILLLDKGASIIAKTRDGLTPLHCAARSGHEQVVDTLLQRHAPITAKTKVNIPIRISQKSLINRSRVVISIFYSFCRR